jgi:dihydrofolate reductase
MIVSLIAALDEERGIGKDGRVPWRLPADLARFKRLTMGRPVIMGRRTWESLPNRPLPGRPNIVITRQPEYAAAGAQIAPSLAAALQLALTYDTAETFIIGGGEIYAQAIRLANRLYLTRVQGRFQTDTRFPEIDSADWTVIEDTLFPANERVALSSRFQILERRKQTTP